MRQQQTEQPTAVCKGNNRSFTPLALGKLTNFDEDDQDVPKFVRVRFGLPLRNF